MRAHFSYKKGRQRDAIKLNKPSYILYSESNAETVELVQSISSEDELFIFLDNYNWDNGFEVEGREWK